MCNVTQGFRFCTCLEINNEPGEPGRKMPEYMWELARYTGEVVDGPVGSIVGPSADMGEGLTRTSVLHVLNSHNGFDFVYTPAEKDSLRISRSRKGSYYEYMSFLYKDGQWKEGMNPAFTSRLEEIAMGHVFKQIDPSKI